MFIGDKIIYLQMQKTGCTYIANYLRDNIGGEIIGKHNWLRDYDTDKKIIGSIRNPWSWYVSLWAYGCERKGGVHHKQTNRWAPFKRNLKKRDLLLAFNDLLKPIDKWRKYYSDADNAENFRSWLKLVYDNGRKKDLGEFYYQHKLSDFAGFMTHRYCKLFLKNYHTSETKKSLTDYNKLLRYDEENNLLDYVIKLENLELDMKSVLGEFGYEYQVDEAEKETHRNKSRHRDTDYYYDEETIRLVEDRERLIIDKYSYIAPIIK